MKKLLIIMLSLACAGSLFALQAFQVSCSNAIPTTAALATVYGHKIFKAEGNNLKVYSEFVDVIYNYPTLTGTVAQAAVTNGGSYTFTTYDKFATTTVQTYEDAFVKGQTYTLWLKTARTQTSSTGTNVVQKVYFIVY